MRGRLILARTEAVPSLRVTVSFNWLPTWRSVISPAPVRVSTSTRTPETSVSLYVKQKARTPHSSPCSRRRHPFHCTSVEPHQPRKAGQRSVVSIAWRLAERRLFPCMLTNRNPCRVQLSATKCGGEIVLALPGVDLACRVPAHAVSISLRR